MISKLPPIVIETRPNPKFAVIWLHGLGANGHDFEPIVPELGLDDLPIRFIFPHAPHRAVSINAGMAMPAWYDIKGIDLADKEDREGLQQSYDTVSQLIDEQIQAGIDTQNIVIAGFSQGGAVALYSLLRYPGKLAGCLALSTYVPFMSQTKAEMSDTNLQTPIFWGHGFMDPVVPILLGEQSTSHLRELGYTVDWHSYNMQHSVNINEINDISQWFKQIFAEALV